MHDIFPAYLTFSLPLVTIDMLNQHIASNHTVTCEVIRTFQPNEAYVLSYYRRSTPRSAGHSMRAARVLMVLHKR
jgi:hypothetical protein